MMKSVQLLKTRRKIQSTPQDRPNQLITIQPYQGGKPIEEVQRELGISDIIKLASNENPLGPSPLAMQAIQEAATQVNLYPDGNAYYLKQDLAAHVGVPPEQPDLRERLQRGAATGRGDLHIAGRRGNLFGKCLCRLHVGREGVRCEIDHYADVRLYAGLSGDGGCNHRSNPRHLHR